MRSYEERRGRKGEGEIGREEHIVNLYISGVCGKLKFHFNIIDT
jgi:hypothetical protein